MTPPTSKSGNYTLPADLTKPELEDELREGFDDSASREPTVRLPLSRVLDAMTAASDDAPDTVPGLEHVTNTVPSGPPEFEETDETTDEEFGIEH